MERCPVCGSPVRAGANFCTACGHRLTSGERAAIAAPESAKSAAVAGEPPGAAVPESVVADAAAATVDMAPPAAAATVEPERDPLTVPWAMPMPAAERRAGDERWGEVAPKASADLWPSPERADDHWSGSKSAAAGLGGEPTGEGYAAWDAAPSSWIGWNTPSEDRVEEIVSLETPEPPVSEADPADDQDETAPFAWPDEPGAERATEREDIAAANEEPAAEAEPVFVAGAATESAEVWAGAASAAEPSAAFERSGDPYAGFAGAAEPVGAADADELADAATDDPARDGWDAYIASRETARAKAAEGDVVARGMSLVEQLRDLLPAIVLSDPATMRRVASDLTAARTEAQAVPQEDLDRLRGVLETSRDNPRDIDAMMDLSKHSVELVELMGSFERYAVAVDRAVIELTQGTAVAGIGAADVADELPTETDPATGSR